MLVLSLPAPAAAGDLIAVPVELAELSAPPEAEVPAPPAVGTDLTEVDWVGEAIGEENGTNGALATARDVAPESLAAPPAVSTRRYQTGRAQYQPENAPVEPSPENEAPIAAAATDEPVNVNVSVRVLSPGDDGAVMQANAAAVDAAGNDAQVSRPGSGADNVGRHGGPQPVAANPLVAELSPAPPATSNAVVSDAPGGQTPSIWIWNWDWSGAPEGDQSSIDPQYQSGEQWYRTDILNLREMLSSDTTLDLPIDPGGNQVTIVIWNWIWGPSRATASDQPIEVPGEYRPPPAQDQTPARPPPSRKARGSHSSSPQSQPREFSSVASGVLTHSTLAWGGATRRSARPAGERRAAPPSSRPNRIPVPGQGPPELPAMLGAAGGLSPASAFFNGLAVLIAALAVAAIGASRRLIPEPRIRLPQAHGSRLERPG
jgi:hypothetical protein